MALVLVADDDDPVRRLVCHVLSLAGHRYYAAANGVEAVALFRSNSNIDLVITDMVMPAMGGAQAVARIRETRPDVPIICMSGCSHEAMPPDVYVLPKPFSPKAVLDLVSRILQRLGT